MRAQSSLHHPGSPTFGDADIGQAAFDGVVHGAGDFLSDHGPHGPSDEPEVHAADDHLAAADLPHSRADGILESGLGHRGFESVFVVFGVLELQGVGRGHLGLKLAELALVKQDGEVLVRTDAFMVIAVGTDPQVLLVLLAGDDRLARRALVPIAFRDLLLLGRLGRDALLHPPEPTEAVSVLAFGVLLSAGLILF